MLRNLNKAICFNLKRSCGAQRYVQVAERSFKSSFVLLNEESAQKSDLSSIEQATLGSIRRPRKKDVKYMSGGAMPIDGNGVLALPKQPERNLINQFYEKRGI